MSADTALMPIPGPVDPVPVPRAAKPRADGRVDLVGLSKDQIRAALEAAGLEPKQAKLRAKQVWHWIYNRGVTDFDGDERHRQGAARLARRALRDRAARSGRGAGLDPTARANGCCRPTTATISRWSSSPMPTAARCASRARSAARSIAASATPARCGWCATSSRRRSSARSCSRATRWANGRASPKGGCSPTS